MVVVFGALLGCFLSKSVFVMLLVIFGWMHLSVAFVLSNAFSKPQNFNSNLYFSFSSNQFSSENKLKSSSALNLARESSIGRKSSRFRLFSKPASSPSTFAVSDAVLASIDNDPLMIRLREEERASAELRRARPRMTKTGFPRGSLFEQETLEKEFARLTRASLRRSRHSPHDRASPAPRLSLRRFLRWDDARLLLARRLISREELAALWLRVVGQSAACDRETFLELNAEIDALFCRDDFRAQLDKEGEKEGENKKDNKKENKCFSWMEGARAGRLFASLREGEEKEVEKRERRRSIGYTEESSTGEAPVCEFSESQFSEYDEKENKEEENEEEEGGVVVSINNYSFVFDPAAALFEFLGSRRAGQKGEGGENAGQPGPGGAQGSDRAEGSDRSRQAPADPDNSTTPVTEWVY